jgi:hypothetical protein
VVSDDSHNWSLWTRPITISSIYLMVNLLPFKLFIIILYKKYFISQLNRNWKLCSVDNIRCSTQWTRRYSRNNRKFDKFESTRVKVFIKICFIFHLNCNKKFNVFNTFKSIVFVQCLTVNIYHYLPHIS